MWRRAVLLVCLLVLVTGCDRSIFAVGRPPVTDVAYASGPDNLLDVYLPGWGSGPFPVVMLIHGTGVGKSYFDGTGTVQDLAANGYAAVTIDYPELTADNPAALINDTACALAWVYNNGGEYPFDTGNVVLMGHSRGASMAALLAAMDDLSPLLQNCAYSLPDSANIKGVVGYGGTYATPETSFSDPDFLSNLQQSGGMTTEQVETIATLFSTIPPEEWRTSPEIPEQLRLLATFMPPAWLDGSEPPFLLVYGENDEFTAPSESQAFARALEAKGIPVTLVAIPGAFHRVNQEALHAPLLRFLAAVTGG
jgi:acetyl esterase/lipase